MSFGLSGFGFRRDEDAFKTVRLNELVSRRRNAHENTKNKFIHLGRAQHSGLPRGLDQNFEGRANLGMEPHGAGELAGDGRPGPE